MRYVCVGKKVINLRYMVTKEEYEGEPDDPPPGVVRVTMEPGKVFNFSGARAEEFLRGLGVFLGASSPPCGILPPSSMQTTDDPKESISAPREGEAQARDDLGQDPPPNQHRA
jgi:hypothetical protein